MARLPRVAVPGVAQHVTQRGNRRQQVFLEDDEYALYLELMAVACRANRVEVWAYCLNAEPYPLLRPRARLAADGGEQVLV